MLRNNPFKKAFVLTYLFTYLLIGLFSMTQPTMAANNADVAAQANNPVFALTAQEASSSLTNSTKTNAQNITLPVFLKAFYLYLSRITLLLAFLMIILAIYVYMGSNGDPKKLTKAKEYLSGAIIGLAAVALAYTFFEVLNPCILNLAGTTTC